MKKNNQAQQPQKTITPEMLLTGVENNARKTGYEQATTIVERFVEQLIHSGQVKTIEDADEKFRKGLDLLEPFIKNRIALMGMQEIESYLPSKAVATQEKP